jgi:hypothetical protein
LSEGLPATLKANFPFLGAKVMLLGEPESRLYVLFERAEIEDGFTSLSCKANWWIQKEE